MGVALSLDLSAEHTFFGPINVTADGSNNRGFGAGVLQIQSTETGAPLTLVGPPSVGRHGIIRTQAPQASHTATRTLLTMPCALLLYA